MRFLLEYEADPNLAHKKGYTSLHKSAAVRAFSGNCDDAQTQIIKLLLSFGADIDARTEDGATPLDIARRNRQAGGRLALLFQTKRNQTMKKLKLRGASRSQPAGYKPRLTV